MGTVTKKDLVDRIADATGERRSVVKRIVQRFLQEIIDNLGQGNRLEFREFGVFECRHRAARVAQNPKTLEQVTVNAKRTIKFKPGNTMKKRIKGPPAPETTVPPPPPPPARPSKSAET